MLSQRLPAEVIKVEDRFWGCLSLAQIGWLSVPIMAGFVLFFGFPPVNQVTGLKLICWGLSGLGSGLLAVRIDGDLIACWLVVIFRYNRRPSFYLGPQMAEKRTAK